MLIVALQDEIDGLFSIYDTVTDRFLGVNLDREDSVKIIMDNKNCSIDDAVSRVEHPQRFNDIAKYIDD